MISCKYVVIKVFFMMHNRNINDLEKHFNLFIKKVGQ